MLSPLAPLALALPIAMLLPPLPLALAPKPNAAFWLGKTPPAALALMPQAVLVLMPPSIPAGSPPAPKFSQMTAQAGRGDNVALKLTANESTLTDTQRRRFAFAPRDGVSRGRSVAALKGATSFAMVAISPSRRMSPRGTLGSRARGRFTRGVSLMPSGRVRLLQSQRTCQFLFALCLVSHSQDDEFDRAAGACMLLTFHKIETSGVSTQSGAGIQGAGPAASRRGALGCPWQRPSCRVKTGA